MADLECSVQTGEKELTVGDRFALSCHGNIPDLDLKAVELKVDEADKYKLKLFQAAKSSDGLQLEVTSYAAGDHEIKAAQLVDSSHSLVLSDMKFHVASVQDPQHPQEKPFGPVGPLHFFPWLVVVLLAALLVAVITPFVVVGLQKRRRTKLIAEIDHQAFQYGPFHEMHRLLRQSQRRYLFLSDAHVVAENKDLLAAFQEIDSAFLTYVTREFRVPIKKWPIRRCLRLIKAEHTQLSEETVTELRQALAELEKARRHPEKNQSQDLLQLLKIVRTVSDKIEVEERRPRSEL